MFGCAESLLLCELFYIIVAVSKGYSVVVGLGLLSVVVSLLAEQGLYGTWALGVAAHGLSSCGSWALEHRFNSCGLSCSVAHGILLDQGSNLSLLHWQEDFLSLTHWDYILLKDNKNYRHLKDSKGRLWTTLCTCIWHFRWNELIPWKPQNSLKMK